MSSNLANPGCLISGPNDPRVCIICQAGYYQDQTGHCNFVGTPAIQKTVFLVVKAEKMKMLMAWMTFMALNM
jgi:hypothetical protein